MHGAPALDPATARGFPYANPAAKAGGTLTQGTVGTFDSLNPFIVMGVPADGLADLVYERLMKRSLDEPFTLYGLLAATIDTPEDRSRVTFVLRPEARFSDGTPVTVEDVIFSFETLRAKGLPSYRIYYDAVTRVERPGPHQVTFIFDKAGDRELPLMLGLMPVLSHRAYKDKVFDRPSLALPLGSGPYVVEDVQAGRNIVYRRNPSYWGKDLWVNAGLNHFERVRFDYFRDQGAAFQAFQAGLLDVRIERDAVRWATAYDFPALRAGKVRRLEIAHGRPSGMYAYVFNTRRPLFADQRVREALVLLFDFDWINKNLFYGAFRRITSYFDNSALAAKEAASPAERALLAPFPDAVTPALLARGWQPPQGGTPARTRENRRAALKLLAAAGFRLAAGRLVHSGTNAPFTFEILLQDPGEERVALAYAAELKTIGITATVRTIDAPQYERRRANFDFDVTPFLFAGTLSPGNEQAFRYGSQAADAPGSYNLAGVRSPAVDALIEQILASRTREELITATRALDRVLLSGTYGVPLYFAPRDRLAARSTLTMPRRPPLMGYIFAPGGASAPLATIWSER